MRRHRIIALAALAAGIGACTEAVTPPSASLAIHVAPLTLPGVTDADYTLAVSAGGETVWTRDITSSRYGDGSGDVSYVGTCDASQPSHVVTLTLNTVYDASGEIPASSYANPTPVSRTVTCNPDADTAVDFELTIARAANQGFFDVAVAFEDLFCSAKLDCENAETGGDIELLHDPATGGRAMTAILGFACTAGPESETWLYLDDVVITCDGLGAPVRVDVSAAGAVDLTAGTSANLDGYLFAASVARGAEQLAGKAYWNVMLGLDADVFAAAGSCTLTAHGTASGEALASTAEGYALREGASYPVLSWEVPLTDAGGRVCTRHAVNAGPEVAVAYAPSLTTPSALRCERAPADGAVSCGSGACAYDTYCLAESCLPFSVAPDVTVSADAVIDATALTAGRTFPEQVDYRVSSIDGRWISLTAPPDGIAAGDEVLLVNLMGTATDSSRVGVHELARVVEVSDQTLTVGCSVTETYAAAGNADLSSQVVRVVRVPHYGSLTLADGVRLTTSAFGSGAGSGVVAMRVDGALTVGVGASIDVSGAGYRGGTQGTTSSPYDGYAGTSMAGNDPSPGSASWLGGGGGGFDYGCGSGGDCGAGGGGGGHYTAGTTGWRSGTQNGGVGGGVYAYDGDGRWYLGAGGGGGGADGPSTNGSGDGPRAGRAGAAGGGLVVILAGSVDNQGTLHAGGADETLSYYQGTGDDEEEGKGGGGAGGTLVVVSGSGPASVGVTDLAGGRSLNCAGSTYYCGGTGGNGRLLTEL